MTNYDAIILGGGAAGLFCGATAGQRGRRVLVLERAEKPGKKILISGGGRCNFTNNGAKAENYLGQNPHFARSALARYAPADFIALIDQYGIAWHEKTLGQLFCDGSARQIVAMLLEECARGGVEVRCDENIATVGHADGRYAVSTTSATFSAPSLVIATGGPSIPQMGASGFAYDLARQFGLKVVEPRPALVPLTLGGADMDYREISGVSADVVARHGAGQFREKMLFTHRGLSGPAVLQISSYWRPGDAIGFDLLPDAPADWLLAAKRANPRATMRGALRAVLPDRLADIVAERLEMAGDLGNVSDAALRHAQAQMGDWRLCPNGSEGFAKAEVTIGGISTDGLSQQTMEARKMPGLFAIGEAVDVTGWLGGYNFQWAWASGHAAGLAL